MSYKNLIVKNSNLTTKLIEYLAANPVASKDIPSGVSYVVFSEDDTKLNEYNLRLVDNLLGEGRNVIKATETKNKKSPWNLNYIPA